MKRLSLLLRICLLVLGLTACPVLLWGSDMMLPRVYRDQPVQGWWMSEKLDGVRAYWDGQQLLSKNGNAFTSPTGFTEGLPDFPLEGELWAGRQRFVETVSIVQRDQAHDGWFRLKFGIFDVPQASGSFALRIEQARLWFRQHPSPYAFVIEQIPVRDRTHLLAELERIAALGGEGLIVRDPQAAYSAGRSSQILKVKHYEDAEARVLEHLPGKGKFAGMMGALLVEMANGTRFRLGTGFTNDEREDPPAVGAIVTFKYYGFYPSGIPKFPSFLRVREDAGL